MIDTAIFNTNNRKISYLPIVISDDEISQYKNLSKQLATISARCQVQAQSISSVYSFDEAANLMQTLTDLYNLVTVLMSVCSEDIFKISNNLNYDKL